MSGDKPRMSLYANLLTKDGDAPGTISGAPVVYKQGEGQKSEDIIAAAKAKLNAAALRFQPTKRPQANAQRTKNLGPKPPAVAGIPAASVLSTKTNAQTDAAASINRQTTKTTIDDWTGDADDDVYYQAEKRQRGGRKKRKKNKESEPQPVNWDDIYDPSRPNSYEEYKNSEERIREVREWKDRLYAHRTARAASSMSDTDDDDRRPPMRNQFVPPGMSFAPPQNLNDSPSQAPPNPRPSFAPPPPPASEGLSDTTGGDAYAPRLRLSQQHATSGSSAPAEMTPGPTIGQQQPDISRAPVRYTFPPAPSELPTSEAELENALQNEAAEEEPEAAGDEERSLRPGQKGFAERMMSKYGWTKGSGLGVKGTGITSALRVQVEKQKRKPDSEGGGLVGPGGRGKIIGGKKQNNQDEGKFGAMSEVVVLRGMVDGLDIRRELGEGNLMQEIGEECGDKYGRVERVFVDQTAGGSIPVFVKFISPLSALRAVNALEGRIFNGNTIQAKFYDKDRFDQGDYAV